MNNTPQTRFLGTLGLAARARKTACGTQNVCEALKAGKAKLVVMACGLSGATEKRITDRTAFYKVELIKTNIEPLDLAMAVGRASDISSVAVLDEQLAKAVKASAEKNLGKVEPSENN